MNETESLFDVFSRLWANGATPDLEAFLFDVGEVDAAQISRLARIDQAERWQRGDRRLVEEYLDRYQALQVDYESAVDLIYHEYLLRENLAERPSQDEFIRRFPQHATALAEQISFHFALARSAGNVSRALSDGTSPGSAQIPDSVSAKLIDRSATASIPCKPLQNLGRYKLLDIVGTGSFGTVYKARDPELDRIVAIKIPRHGNVASNDDLERFLREARSVARLRHPSIVSIYEIGRSDQTPFLVSEFVQGTTLVDHMSVRQPSSREVAELVATLADTLHYAHEMGVIHRDVKPANIMLDESNKPRLMDFGLARRDAGDATMTIEGQLLGTPAYMSPEQARGETRNVDRRSDIYSLGVVLYQFLTGEMPFTGTTQVLLHQVLNEEARRPRSLNHLISRDLETICLKAMAKEPGRRYQTARDLADDLRRFLRDEPIHARAIGATERMWRWCRRKPALASLAAIVGILVAAIALSGTAVVSILLGAIAVGGTLAAVQFRRQAQKEKSLRNEADENLYYHRIALVHRDLVASPPRPGRAEELLDACPVARRNWEWHYLKRFWRTEPVVLRAPDGGKVRGIAFSHDGSQLAASYGDGKIRVWNQKTGEMVILPGHDAFVYSVAFSPVDSNRLASSGNDGWIRVWDVHSKRETLPRPLPGLQVFAVGMASCVTFSPDGKLIAAASEAGSIIVWDAAQGHLIHRYDGHELQASCVAFSRDGRLLGSGDWQGVVRIWDAQTNKPVQELQLPEHRWPVACLAFSPDSAARFLAAGYFNNRVDVWDTSTGEIHRELQGHSGFITSVAFHPHDARRLVSAGDDRDIRIWDVPTGREVLRLQGHIDNCSGLAFRPDGRMLASASYDQTIRLWDATTLSGNLPKLLHTFDIGREVWSVAISRDGTLIAAAGDRTNVRIWDTRTHREVRTFSTEFSTMVFSLAFNPDGRSVAAAGFDNGIPPTVLKILDIHNGHPILEHREGQEIFATEFSPDGRWLAFGLADGSVKLADAMTGKMVAFVGKHDDPIAYGGVRFRHDGLGLASASLDGTARIWDLTSALSAADQVGQSVARPESDHLRVQMPSRDSGIALWSACYSPDGRHLITGDKDGRLKRWNVDTGEELETKIEASRGAYLSVAYSPNGNWIVSASEDCTARVYDARTMELVQRFRGHIGPIRCLAVNDDFVVTGGTDNTVNVWSLQ